MSSKKLLSINSLTAGYGEAIIIRDVSIDLYVGEIVSLIGPNGAGKSTVIKSIFGITKVESGDIFYQGESILGLDSFSLVKRRLIYLNQGRVIFGNLTVKENLMLAGEILFPTEEIKKKIEDVLETFPTLKPKLDQFALFLSGGQRQQLALARALIQCPKILLLDEPTLGLSPMLQKELFDNIVLLRKRNVACLMVEQNTRTAVNISDRTYLLENGIVALEGSKDILENPMIKKVYLGG